MSTEKYNSILTEEVRDLLNKIEEKIFDGDYIYRGEPKFYDEVSSNLYRQYKGKIDAENFNIGVVHDEIAREASGYTTLKDKFDIMAELQHFGGKTNLIDFTKDYRIALFFSCNGLPKENGRLIFLNRDIETEEYDFHEPHSPQNRVISQKSIFIQPVKGCLNPQEEDIIRIPAKMKNNILDYLNRCHAISAATVYNDLHGFIKNRHTHESAYTMFFRGLTNQENAIKEPDKKEEHTDKAILCYDEAIQLNPQFSEAYNNRGNAKDSLEYHQEAKTDYDKAIELEPQMSEAYNNRGNTMDSLGDRRRAMDDFDKAIKLNPQNAGAYYNRGKLFDDLGDHREAINNYDKAIKFNPQLAEAYNNRGIAKNIIGHHREAIADYDEVIKLNPQLIESYINRGNSKNHLSDIQGAIDDFNKAIELNPQIPAAYNNRGSAYNNLGNYRAAITNYSKAIELNPQYINAYSNRGNAKGGLGKYREAIIDFDTAIELNPQFAKAHYFRGLAKKKLHDPAAKQDFEQTIFLANAQGEKEIVSWAQQRLDELKRPKNLPTKKD